MQLRCQYSRLRRALSLPFSRLCVFFCSFLFLFPISLSCFINFASCFALLIISQLLLLILLLFLLLYLLSFSFLSFSYSRFIFSFSSPAFVSSRASASSSLIFVFPPFPAISAFSRLLLLLLSFCSSGRSCFCFLLFLHLLPQVSLPPILHSFHYSCSCLLFNHNFTAKSRHLCPLFSVSPR